MTFASIEARINNAVLAHLANVTATVGGVSVSAIFDNGYNAVMGIDGSTPVITAKSSDVSSAVRGTAVVVDGVSYTVQGIEPDGLGITRLILELV